MSHRSYGETRDCKGCRYWSEMIAGCEGCGPVKALCLAPKPAPKHGQYMAGSQSCEAWASGHLGAVDEPGQDPDAYRDPRPCQSCGGEGRLYYGHGNDPEPHSEECPRCEGSGDEPKPPPSIPPASRRGGAAFDLDDLPF